MNHFITDNHYNCSTSLTVSDCPMANICLKPGDGVPCIWQVSVEVSASGWTDSPTLSLGAELNWQYCGLLAKPLPAVAAVPIVWSVSVQTYVPSTTWWKASESAAVHLRKLSATWISFLLVQTSHKLHIWLDKQFCFLTESVLDFCRKAWHSHQFCSHPTKELKLSFTRSPWQFNWHHKYTAWSVNKSQMSINANETAT